MYKKVALMILAFTAWSGASFAENCPSVADLKNNKFSGWVAYDSEDGKPLPPAHVAQLVTYIDQFALAEWVDGKKSPSAIHCYYRDKHGSDLEAYFAKDNYKPNNIKSAWYQVSGYMHCAAGSDQCSFNNVIGPEQQLANR